MERKPTGFICVALVCLALLCAFLVVLIHPGHLFQQVTLFRGDALGYYGLDQQEEGYLLFAQAEKSNHNLLVPYDQEGFRLRVLDLFRDNSGQIYGVMAYQDQNLPQNPDTMVLCRWDFSQGSLVEVAEVSDLGEYAGSYESGSGVSSLLFLTEGGLSSYTLSLDKQGDFPLAPGEIHDLVPYAQGALVQDHQGALFLSTQEGLHQVSLEALDLSLKNVNFMAYQDSIAFYNLDKKAYYQVSPQGGGYGVSLEPTLNRALGELPSWASLPGLLYQEAQGIFTGLSLDNAVQVPVLYGDSSALFDRIPQSNQEKQLLFVAVFLPCLLVFALLWLIFTGKLVLGQGITLWFLVLVFGVLWLFASHRWAKDYDWTENQQLTIEGYYRTVTEYAKSKETELPEDSPLEVWIRTAEALNSQKDTLFQGLGAQVTDIAFYQVEGQELYSLWAGQLAPAPIDYRLPPVQCQALYTSVQSNQVVIQDFFYHESQELLVEPLYNRQGDLLAVLEIRISTQEINRENQEKQQGYLQGFFLCHLMLLLLILLVVWWNTRKLSRVHDTIEEILEGDLDARIPPLGSGEIGHLAQTFNQMCGQIQEKISHLQGFHQACQGFFSPFLFQQLHPQGILQTRPSDTALIQGVTLQVFFQEETFPADLLEPIQKQATILRLTPQRIKALVKDPGQSVELALCLCQYYQHQDKPGFHLLLRKETEGIGIFGGETTRHLSFLSSSKTFSKEMVSLLAALDLRVVVTRETLSQVGQESTFRLRLLGYIMLQSGKTESLFELLEATPQEEMRLKLDTKVLLEEGIAFLVAGEKALASKRFMEVLQKNPQDKVAQFYLRQYQEGAPSFYLYAEEGKEYQEKEGNKP